MEWKCIALFGIMLIFPVGLFMVSRELRKYKHAFKVKGWQIMIEALSIIFGWIALPASVVIIFYVLFKCLQTNN